MPISLSSGKDYDARENVPTLRQYLAGLGKGKLSPRYVVQVIWKPNKFSNFTFETEKFRVRVATHSELGKALLSLFAEWEDNQPLLAIKIDDRDSSAFSIIDLPEERATWESLGESGYRLKVLPRK